LVWVEREERDVVEGVGQDKEWLMALETSIIRYQRPPHQHKRSRTSKSARKPQEESKGYKAEAGKSRINMVQSTFQVLLHFLNDLLGIVLSIELRWIV